MRWRDRRHCPHARLRGIFGDEINAAGGRRLECLDCGRLLDGPVALAALLRRAEADRLNAAEGRRRASGWR